MKQTESLLCNYKVYSFSQLMAWPLPITPVSLRPANICMALTALVTDDQDCSWPVEGSEAGRYPYFVNQSYEQKGAHQP